MREYYELKTNNINSSLEILAFVTVLTNTYGHVK